MMLSSYLCCLPALITLSCVKYSCWNALKSTVNDAIFRFMKALRWTKLLAVHSV